MRPSTRREPTPHETHRNLSYSRFHFGPRGGYRPGPDQLLVPHRLSANFGQWPVTACQFFAPAYFYPVCVAGWLVQNTTTGRLAGVDTPPYWAAKKNEFEAVVFRKL